MDADGSLLGVVSAGDVEQALASSAPGTDARALVHETPELLIDETLEDAVWRLGSTDDDGLPVLDQAGEHLVGWLTHRQLLATYRGRLSANAGSSARPNGKAD